MQRLRWCLVLALLLLLPTALAADDNHGDEQKILGKDGED